MALRVRVPLLYEPLAPPEPVVSMGDYVIGASLPFFINETGTRQAIINATFVNETIAVTPPTPAVAYPAALLIPGL